LWATLNYLVWLGLRRYGFDGEAKELAARGWRTFATHWADRRCWENLNQRTGEGGDSPDSDPFYTWGALLAVIGELDPGEPFPAPPRREA
jgi:putative isomerase